MIPKHLIVLGIKDKRSNDGGRCAFSCTQEGIKGAQLASQKISAELQKGIIHNLPVYHECSIT